jgi:hypothetical protein
MNGQTQNIKIIINLNFFKMAKKRYCKTKAILDLELMALDRKKQNYPNNPHLVQPKYRDDTSNDLTKCIINLITFNGYQAERINSMGRQVQIPQTYRQPSKDVALKLRLNARLQRTITKVMNRKTTKG